MPIIGTITIPPPVRPFSHRKRTVCRQRVNFTVCEKSVVDYRVRPPRDRACRSFRTSGHVHLPSSEIAGRSEYCG